MPQHRCYFLDHRYYVVASRMITCESDEAARTVYPAVEVWEGQRQVYEVKKLAPI